MTHPKARQCPLSPATRSPTALSSADWAWLKARQPSVGTAAAASPQHTRTVMSSPDGRGASAMGALAFAPVGSLRQLPLKWRAYQQLCPALQWVPSQWLLGLAAEPAMGWSRRRAVAQHYLLPVWACCSSSMQIRTQQMKRLLQQCPHLLRVGCTSSPRRHLLQVYPLRLRVGCSSIFRMVRLQVYPLLLKAGCSSIPWLDMLQSCPILLRAGHSNVPSLGNL